MTITAVGNARTSGSAASPGPTISYSSTGGNTLIICGSWYSNTTANTGISSITDSAGNTWQYSTSDTQNPPAAHNLILGQYYGVFIGWCLNANAVTSVTVKDGTGNSDFWHVVVSEWSGIGSADTGASKTDGAPPVTNPPSPSITLANAGDLVIACSDTINGFDGTQPSGSTEFSSDNTIYDLYALPGSAGAFSFTWPSAATTDDAIAIMAFSPPTAPSSPPAVLYSMRSMP